MIDCNIKEYTRLINSISLAQSDKDRIVENLIKKRSIKKEISGKQVAVASVAAVLAFGVFYAVKAKQNINIM